MGNQDGEVDTAYQAMPGKMAIAVDAMIEDVADQEQRGKDESGLLAKGVQFAIAGFDGEPAADEEDRSGRVEPRIDGGKEGQSRSIARAPTQVEKPEQESDRQH